MCKMSNTVCALYKKQEELLILRQHLSSSHLLVGPMLLIFFSFLCCVFCFVCLHFVSCVQCGLCLCIVHYWLSPGFSRTFNYLLTCAWLSSCPLKVKFLIKVWYYLIFECFVVGYRVSNLSFYVTEYICFVEWVSNCCLTPTQQFFSYIMAKTS